MLSPDDYKCESRNGIFLCVPNTNDVYSLYRVLQDRLRLVAGTMAAHRPDVPKSLSTLIVDGRPGPTTALAAQVVLAAMHQLAPLPTELLPILSDTAPGDEIIRLVSQHADAVLTYVDQTLTRYPNILQPQVQPLAPLKPAKEPITKVAFVAAGGATLLLGGLLFAIGRAQKASDGRQDRSHFLPEPTEEELAALEAQEAEQGDDDDDAGADAGDADNDNDNDANKDD